MKTHLQIIGLCTACCIGTLKADSFCGNPQGPSSPPTIDDKYAHCVAHCEISRDLGPEVSDAIGKGKEFADWCKKQLGGGGSGWDDEDENANKDGRSAAKDTQKSCEVACGEKGYSP
jgi:hypothetical protein